MIQGLRHKFESGRAKASKSRGNVFSPFTAALKLLALQKNGGPWPLRPLPTGGVGPVIHVLMIFMLLTGLQVPPYLP